MAFGCSTPAPFNDNPDTQSFPVDQWVDQAQSWLSKSKSADKNSYTVYNMVDSQEFKITFDSTRTISHATFFFGRLDSMVVYYEKQRPAYATFSDRSSRNFESGLLAFANNEPFAAAYLQNNSWESTPVANLPHSTEFTRFLAAAMESAQREKKSRYENRLCGRFIQLQAKTKAKGETRFVLNTRKGEHLKISVQSTDRQVYFTVGDAALNKMIDHQNFQTKIARSGDLIVDVFSVGPDVRENEYVLEIKREAASLQNPVFSQVP